MKASLVPSRLNCAVADAGTSGPDRITKTIYDAAGQVSQNRVAVGTSLEAAERTLTYTSNGELQTLTAPNSASFSYNPASQILSTTRSNDRFTAPCSYAKLGRAAGGAGCQRW